MKARRKKRRGEAFTRISLLFKALEPIRGEEQEGETFTHILLYIKGLVPKGEEVKAKTEKRRTRARARRGGEMTLKGGEKVGRRIKKQRALPKRKCPLRQRRKTRGALRPHRSRTVR